MQLLSIYVDPNIMIAIPAIIIITLLFIIIIITEGIWKIHQSIDTQNKIMMEILNAMKNRNDTPHNS